MCLKHVQQQNHTCQTQIQTLSKWLWGFFTIEHCDFTILYITERLDEWGFSDLHKHATRLGHRFHTLSAAEALALFLRLEVVAVSTTSTIHKLHALACRAVIAPVLDVRKAVTALLRHSTHLWNRHRKYLNIKWTSI